MSGGGGHHHSADQSSVLKEREDNLPLLDRYNQRQMDNNYGTTTGECRLFINPNVYSDYAIGRYIDDTSQTTRTVSSATSTAALGQDSWTWRSVSPRSHSDLVRSVSNGGAADNWSATVGATATAAGAPPPLVRVAAAGGKFKLLRAKFIRSRRNKLNRLSNKIGETTEHIKARGNGFQQQDKFRMQPHTAAAAALVATSIAMPPKVKPPKVKPKVARGGMSAGGGGGGGRGGGAGGVGDINDPMLRRPRRRVSDQKKRKEDEFYAQFVSPEKYDQQTWYL